MYFFYIEQRSTILADGLYRFTMTVSDSKKDADKTVEPK